MRSCSDIEVNFIRGPRGYRANISKARLLASSALASLALCAAPAWAQTYSTTGDYPAEVVLDSPTTLTAEGSVIATVTGVVSGAQPLQIDGPGIVVFGNTGNDWTGLTTILRDATLRGSTDTIAGSAVVVAEFGKLDFVQSGAGVFSRDISGSGTVWVSGLDEDEAVTFSGTVTIDTGLMAGTDGHIAIADTGSVTVTGTASTVLLEHEGSSLNNAGTLTQNGVSSAVNVQVGATVENSGTITAQSDAVYFAHGGGEINNLAGGRIVSVTASAIVVHETSTTVNNSGMITSADVAIRLGETGTITNRTGGTINTDNFASAIFGTGTTGTVSFTNEDGGTLTSGGAMIELYNRGEIDNSGLMDGGDGIWLNGGGSIVNRAGATISANNGDAYAVWSVSSTDDVTVENDGTIHGGAIGIASDGGGKVTIVNSGAITTGDQWAIYLSGADDSFTSKDGSTTTGDVAMDNGNDEVEFQAGSTMTGDVYGGEGDDSFILMASAMVTGDLYGGADEDTLTLNGEDGDGGGGIDIGTIIEFETLVKEGTGDWTLTGSNAMADTQILAGTGALAGKLIFDGTASLESRIDVNGATIRAATAGAFGSGTIHAIDPTIEFGATGTYANDISLDVAAPATNDPTTLSADSGVTATLSGKILRGGGDTVQPLAIAGEGTIVLTNTENSWSGVTSIAEGSTLQGMLDTISGSSFIADGTLAFVQSLSGTLDRDVSGGGKVSVSGLTAGNIFGFTGALTNDGGVESDDGANIEVGSAGSISAAGVAVKFTGGFDNTLSLHGAISTADEDGTAVELGAGDDIFNNYAGSVAGIVDAEAGSDTLNIDRGAATAYNMVGSSWLNFEITNILSGTVSLIGDYESSSLFNVASGAALVAGGTVTTASFLNEGVLVVGPVSGPGTLLVDGDFENAAGATYVVKFDGTGADLLDITGTATLSGTLEVTGLASIARTTFTILTADGGITGVFALAGNLSPLVRAALDYDSNNVLLSIDPVADSDTGRAIADALFKSSGAGPELTQVLNDIGGMSLEDAGKALDQLAPEQSDAPANGTTQTVTAFHQQTADRIGALQSDVAASQGGTRLALGGHTDGDLTASLVGGSVPDAGRGGLWGRAFGLGGALDASAGAANGFSYKGGGFTGGFDSLIGERTLVGLSAGYARVLNDPDRAGASSEVKSYSIGVYAATLWGAADFSGQLGYTKNKYHGSRRIVVLPATNAIAASDFGGSTVSANVEAGYTLTVGSVALRPVLGFDWMHLRADGYTETGAPGLNLTQASHSDNLVRSTVGVGAALTGGTVVPSLGLRWGHDIERPDGALSYAFAGLANSSFLVDRNTPDRDALLVDAGIEAKLGKALDLSVAASADLRDNAQGYGLSVKLRYNW